MTTCSDLADYEWLTGSEAGAVLEELAAETTPLHTMVARLRNRFTQTRTHLLLEQVELRRRAAAKFSRPYRMFFTRLGLEQASDEWVARYKASRIKRAVGFTSTVFADLCCGVGGDLIGLVQTGPAIGVDFNAAAAHFAA